MTYEKALEFIHGATRAGARDGLGRMRRVLEIIGSPQKRLKFVHVAGTNGKGSTCTMTAAILTAAGYKTGLFISPYVVDFRERIQINGEMIGKQQLADAVEQLLPAFEQVKRELSECTEFETVTAIALYLYDKLGCDIVVLEVGIGGKDDKTNVIDPPEVAAICSIAFDHTHILGGTLAEIAAHKCGIIKPGCAAAAYPLMAAEGLEVFKNTCAENGVTPNIPDLSLLEILSCEESGSLIKYRGQEYKIPLVGRHQIYNTLTVLAICEELEKRGWRLPYDTVRRAIECVSFVGRFEVVHRDPLCIIDGGHNIEGASSVCDSIDRFFSHRPVTIVMGMLEDKDYEECITMVAKRASRFIAVTPDSYRALVADKAAAIASRYCGNVTCARSAAEGVETAIAEAGEDGVVIACGSLYMIGEIKKLFPV